MEAMPELEKIRTLVNQANLTEDARRAANWCLSSLPRLYEQLRSTNESRFGDDIQRMVQGTCKTLVDEKSADGRKIARAFVVFLQVLHERLGIQVLTIRTRTTSASSSLPTRRTA
jgi:hypothetical protein